MSTEKMSWSSLTHSTAQEKGGPDSLRTQARWEDRARENRDFREASELLKLKAPERLVVIDEFSYLLLTDKNAPAVFQHVIDEILDEGFFLILSGSIIGLMEGLMEYGNPSTAGERHSSSLSP